MFKPNTLQTEWKAEEIVVTLCLYLKIIEEEMSVCKLKDQLFHLQAQIKNCGWVLYNTQHIGKQWFTVTYLQSRSLNLCKMNVIPFQTFEQMIQ